MAVRVPSLTLLHRNIKGNTSSFSSIRVQTQVVSHHQPNMGACYHDLSKIDVIIEEDEQSRHWFRDYSDWLCLRIILVIAGQGEIPKEDRKCVEEKELNCSI